MSIRSRIDHLEDTFGVGRLWDSVTSVEFIRTNALGGQSPDAPAGAKRCATMMGACTGLYWIMQPDSLRIRQANAPTAEGRQQMQERIDAAEAKAAEVREMVGAEPHDNAELVVERLIEHCRDAGFTHAELIDTRKKLDQSRRNFTRNQA
jgi:hypothetical protein